MSTQLWTTAVQQIQTIYIVYVSKNVVRSCRLYCTHNCIWQSCIEIKSIQTEKTIHRFSFARTCIHAYARVIRRRKKKKVNGQLPLLISVYLWHLFSARVVRILLNISHFIRMYYAYLRTHVARARVCVCVCVYRARRKRDLHWRTVSRQPSGTKFNYIFT